MKKIATFIQIRLRPARWNASMKSALKSELNYCSPLGAQTHLNPHLYNSWALTAVPIYMDEHINISDIVASRFPAI